MVDLRPAHLLSYLSALGPWEWVRFLSRRGCTQGCPAGSLCFAAALQDSLETVATEFFSDCLLLAIHDDVFVCGPPARAAPAAALRRLLTLATQSCGLTPSGHKFTAYCATEVPEYTANQLHQELDAWTPAEQLHQGRQC